MPACQIGVLLEAKAVKNSRLHFAPKTLPLKNNTCKSRLRSTLVCSALPARFLHPGQKVGDVVDELPGHLEIDEILWDGRLAH